MFPGLTPATSWLRTSTPMRVRAPCTTCSSSSTSTETPSTSRWRISPRGEDGDTGVGCRPFFLKRLRGQIRGRHRAEGGVFWVCVPARCVVRVPAAYSWRVVSCLSAVGTELSPCVCAEVGMHRGNRECTRVRKRMKGQRSTPPRRSRPLYCVCPSIAPRDPLPNHPTYVTEIIHGPPPPIVVVGPIRVLPLCNNYVRVNRFASERGQYEFGKVAHALAAGMQRLLREYLVLVAQLENQFLQVCRLCVLACHLWLTGGYFCRLGAWLQGMFFGGFGSNGGGGGGIIFQRAFFCFCGFCGCFVCVWFGGGAGVGGGPVVKEGRAAKH